MSDDSSTPLASATPDADLEPNELDHLSRSAATAACDEYAEVHGSLPNGCPSPNVRPRAAVAWLRTHQHGLDDEDPEAASALCLSGGGIRSATFGLGVLQGLAKAGQLSRFHYMSSVSGGGYIASWLSSWMRRATHPDQVIKALANSAGVGSYGGPGLPHGAAAVSRTPLIPQPEPESEPPAIRHLRSYSNYLSPAIGLSGDLMALVAIFLRNLILHWAVLLPLLAAVLMLPRLIIALLPLDRWLQPWALCALTAMAVCAVVLSIAYMAADLPAAPPPQERRPKDGFQRWNLLPLGLASLLFTLLAPWLTTTASISGVLPWRSDAWDAASLKVLNVPLCALLMWGFFGAFVHTLGAVVGWLWRRFCRKIPARSRPLTRPWLIWDLFCCVLVGWTGGDLLLVVLMEIGSWLPVTESANVSVVMAARVDNLILHEAFIVVGPPLTLGVFWFTVTIFTGLTRGLKSEEDREWWARAAGQWMLLALGWMALAAVVVLLPRWLLELPQAFGLPDGAAAVGIGTALLGVLSSMVGYWSKNGQKITGQVRGLVGRFGTGLLSVMSLLFLLLLMALIGIGISATLGVTSKSENSLYGQLQLSEVQALKQVATCSAPNRVAVAVDSCATSASLDPLRRSVINFRASLHDNDHAFKTSGITVLLFVVGGLMSWFVGVNTFSLHSMYANRLSRAYLGASNEDRHPHWFTGFDPDDNPTLATKPFDPSICAPNPLSNPGDLLSEHVIKSPVRLFHVINTALNLVQASGGRLEWQQRKAASFTFTPLHCGSALLGYVPTQNYSRGLNSDKGLSVGRAMAISGAAASPNMGYHSSTFVAMVMSLFNVRLGWWMPNTREASKSDWALKEPSYGLNTLLAETLSHTSAERDFVYLSDGGHFENLGLYEMVRRRCRFIVITDATADADYRHDDLQSAVRKIRIDLGVSVEFPFGLPTAESVLRTGEPWAIGRVVYSDIDKPDPQSLKSLVPNGHIVYLKPALWNGLPLDVESYARSLPKQTSSFPHQGTKDQFFDESQFESYRMLGLLTALKAFGSGSWPTGTGPDHRPNPASPTPAALGITTEKFATMLSDFRKKFSL